MIQKRLFRTFYPDDHYCAALFHYQREFAIKYRILVNFVCINDKHKIRVREPGFSTAAPERGREVIVLFNETFIVGDHDFTHFSFTPVLFLSYPFLNSLKDLDILEVGLLG